MAKLNLYEVSIEGKGQAFVHATSEEEAEREVGNYYDGGEDTLVWTNIKGVKDTAELIEEGEEEEEEDD